MFVNAIIFQAVLISLAIAIGAVFAGIWFARRAGLIDYPNAAPHKKHAHPTPMAGGIAIILTLIVTGALFELWKSPIAGAVFAAGMVIFLFGIWDDLRPITVPVKLFGQIFAAILLIRGGIMIGIFESPEFFVQLPGALPKYADWGVTVLWIVGITNAFNFIDSMDGLAVGIGGVAAGFFTLANLGSGQMELAVFSAIMIGMCMGIYFFNARPARIFLGDGGAQTLGFLLGVLAITYQPRDVNQMSSWFVTILLLIVPIFDMSLVVMSRLRRRRPIYTSARDHTYHRLQKLGLDPNRAVLLMHIAAVISGCFAVIGMDQTPLVGNMIFIGVLICSLALLVFFETKFDDLEDAREVE